MKYQNYKTIVFTGGGTGGHVFPGIAVAEKLLLDKDKTSFNVAWIGSNSGMEREILNRYNISFHSIPAGKFRRYFSIKNFIDIFKIIAGFIVSIFLLKKLKADILFSKGGFVTVPPVIAAKLLKIPVISHESDLDPGLATRINGRFSKKILFAYKETLEHWENKKTNQTLLVTGNPVRSEIMSVEILRSKEKIRKQYNISDDRKIILVLGGSQGALEINNMIKEIIYDLTKNYFIIHQMGEFSYKKSEINNYITTALFHEEFPEILAAADIVVSRAGAGTLWENGILGKPSILIPLGFGSSRGDQVRNANFFGKNSAAIVLKDDDTGALNLLLEIDNLLNNKKKLNKLEENVKLLCNRNSADQIVNIIYKEIGYINEYSSI